MEFEELFKSQIDPEQIKQETLQAIQEVNSVFGGGNILAEVAKAESNLGQHPNTFRPNYHGGVMQVDKIGFEDTKDTKSHPKLKQAYKRIKESFGIDWNDVRWEDLRDPFISVIAARLKFLTIPDKIPDTLLGRAKYWKKYYNTGKGKGTVEHYIESNSLNR